MRLENGIDEVMEVNDYSTKLKIPFIRHMDQEIVILTIFTRCPMNIYYFCFVSQT